MSISFRSLAVNMLRDPKIPSGVRAYQPPFEKIAVVADIKVPLTTYTARHTWATLARDYGAPISVISAGLGHTSEEMTRVYLKDFDVSMLNQVNSIVTNLSK